MVDVLTREQRHLAMSRIRSKDTKPEMIVRRSLHGIGYRYRLHAAKLPGKPDLVFQKRRKVIFVHGCFWHSHTCTNGQRKPKTNPGFWEDKRERTVARDAQNVAALKADGWDVLVVWECELKPGGEWLESACNFLGTTSWTLTIADDPS